MPTGRYKRTKYHKDITSLAIKKLYEKGNSNMGFKNGHKDIVSKESRKRASFKMKEIHASRKKSNYIYSKHSEKANIEKSIRMRGNKTNFWKGGVTKINKIYRSRVKYKQWRKAVFERDNYICQKCNTKSGNGKRVYLEVHHIKNFAQYQELRFDINNGITFCKNCHEEFHKIYGKKNNTISQIIEFRDLYCGEKPISEFEIKSLKVDNNE